MKEIFGLTRADRDLLDELHRRFGTLRENAPSARLPIDITDEPPQAPEVYIALIPPDGIPACEGTTGTGGPNFEAGDVPGYADCGIYRLVNGIIYYTRQTKRVYNLSGDVITQQWITVKRDKFGQWFADTGGAGCECLPRNEKWQINVIGDPTGGSFSLTFNVGPTGDTVVINWDSSAAAAQTAFEGHSEIGAGNVEVVGGPLPDINLSVEFKGTLAATPIDVVTINKTSLTGAAGSALGIIITEPVPGYAAP